MHTFTASDGTRIHHNGDFGGRVYFNSEDQTVEGKTDDQFGDRLLEIARAAMSGSAPDLGSLPCPINLSKVAFREYAAHTVRFVATEGVENLSVDQLLNGEVTIPLPKLD